MLKISSTSNKLEVKFLGIKLKIKLNKIDTILQKISQSLTCKIDALYLKRNINLYVENYFFGMHHLHKQNLTEIEQIKYLLEEIKLKLQFIYFHKIYIPHLEFVLTTKCTLKCKDCVNHIPFIENKNHQVYQLSDFQKDLDNLLSQVSKLDSLCLLGGEPLLVKNLAEMVDYAANKNKINKLYIVTNGTILLSTNLIKVLKKHHKKIWILLSNYSKNPELKGIIKDEQIIEQLKLNDIQYLYNPDLTWTKSTPTQDFKRTAIENRQVFLKCLHRCASIVDGKIYVCPRASTMFVRHLINFVPPEYIDVRHQKGKKLKQSIIKFYQYSQFSACGYCNYINEHEQVTPALQIK